MLTICPFLYKLHVTRLQQLIIEILNNFFHAVTVIDIEIQKKLQPI